MVRAALAASLLAAAPALADPDGRTVVVDYTAGPGDVVCLAAATPRFQGVGCVLVVPQAGESLARIVVRDTAAHALGPVGFAVCSPHCGGTGSLGVGCGAKTISVVPWQRVLIFLDEAYGPFDCYPLGAAVAGTVTVAFG